MDKSTAKSLIAAVCAVTTDAGTLAVAEWAMMQPGGRASQFLHHYLAGSGLPIYVNIPLLLAEDRGVASTVNQGLTASLGKLSPVLSGNIPLPQRAFANRDWQYATGSVNMRWSARTSLGRRGIYEVTLSFTNEYRWHPKEPRIDQCVHEAAERLKTTGAKDFTMIGSPYKMNFTPSQTR